MSITPLSVWQTQVLFFGGHLVPVGWAMEGTTNTSVTVIKTVKDDDMMLAVVARLSKYRSSWIGITQFSEAEFKTEIIFYKSAVLHMWDTAPFMQLCINHYCMFTLIS